MADAVPMDPGRPELPTGVLTFLFTDIEGSTRLLQDLGPRYADLLATHDAIVRRAIHDHDGVEVNTEGDAFFAVFGSAASAASAAIEAQRSLASGRWPGESVVRVRIGLHTGQAVLGGKDYVGLDVHLAARVAAAAHGGQILLSDAARALIEPAADPAFQVRDLGAYRLKGLDQPVRLHQLAVDGLPADFPPPRAKRLGVLPTPRTSFIGRRASLRELEGLLAGTRLLVLTGPGGAGKTRLALELARTVADDRPDGAFFVPLESVGDPRIVPSAVLAALEVPTGGRQPEEALREALAPMDALLVLDNVEQIAGVGAAIDGLLEAAPDVRVVATSRVALRVYGEQEYRVPPLDLPADGSTPALEDVATWESVALFGERARASRPDFRLTQANAHAVVEICRRLDGLPLAIELAAARVRMLAPEDILARLDQCLRLLEDRAPNLPPRQRSIRAAIEWSHDLLDEGEQRTLRRLSVFAGGWDLAAAEAVCDPDGDLGIDVLDAIGSLLDKSLVDRDETASGPRFRMLQTIRAFARERLAASGEDDVVARRHAEHVRRVVESAEGDFTGPDPAAAVARVAPDQDNIRAALDWAVANDAAETGLAIGAAAWRLWQLRGQLSEGRRSLDALLALPGATAPSTLRARALTAAGGILYWQGDPAASERYREALAIHESLADEAGVAESLSNLGFVAVTATPPDAERARGYFLESLRRYERLGDERMVASVTGSLGFTEMVLGRLDAAREAIERALELNLGGGYRARAADNRFALGNIHRRAGRLAESAAMYGAALADALEMRDATRTLMYLSAIGGWAADRGHLGDALRLHGAVLRAAREQGGTLSTPSVLSDPVAMARDAGLDETTITAALEAGERLSVDDAVGLARGLIDEPSLSPGSDGTT
jgi:predicted ATPase/class 3 adenylate cyclase